MAIKLLDTVVLTRDIDAHGLRAGDIGAVVEVYSPTDYEVEFVTIAGQLRALLTLGAAQIRPLSPEDVPSVRKLDAA